jgi:FKBP12-rapamycin complex-associated protein
VWSTEDRHEDDTYSLDLAENKERWLAKLGDFSDALSVYEEKLMRNPNNFDAALGCMKCLSSSGEWHRVLELAEDHWPTIASPADMSAVSQATVIASREQKKALRMCAEAAWRLGRWGDLEKYSTELVHGQKNLGFGGLGTAAAKSSQDGLPRVDFEGAFYSAVLHVHREEWTMAAEAIDAARKAMDGRFTALMAESYNRAYQSMVTAQTLAEMEEIIEFQKSCSNAGAHQQHRANSPDSTEARDRLLSVWRDRLAGCRFDAEVHSNIMAVRSLILGPTDEVDSMLTLSELSRQAQRFKLAERVLLDPLEQLGANLNGAVFGFGLNENLDLHNGLHDAMKHLPVTHIIDELVTNDSLTYLPNYGQIHHQWSSQLVQEAGGLER